MGTRFNRLGYCRVVYGTARYGTVGCGTVRWVLYGRVGNGRCQGSVR